MGTHLFNGDKYFWSHEVFQLIFKIYLINVYLLPSQCISQKVKIIINSILDKRGISEEISFEFLPDCILKSYMIFPIFEILYPALCLVNFMYRYCLCFQRFKKWWKNQAQPSNRFTKFDATIWIQLLLIVFKQKNKTWLMKSQRHVLRTPRSCLHLTHQAEVFLNLQKCFHQFDFSQKHIRWNCEIFLSA